MSGTQSLDLIESDGLLKVQFLEDNTINIVDSKAHKILSFSSEKYHKSNDFTVLPLNGKFLQIAKKTLDVSVFLGVIKLKLNKYLVFGKHSLKVGSLKDQFDSNTYHQVNKIIDYEIVPLDYSINENITDEENTYLKIFKENLLNSSLYFSNTLDLTNTQQTLNKLGSVSTSIKNLNTKFQWNNYLTKDLIEDPESHSFITPIIYGYVKVLFTTFHDEKIQLSLITRRSIKNAGTRYFRRGANEDGNVANFNETEQVVYLPEKNKFLSFLQIRGSVPIQWCEVNNLQYKPQLYVNNFEEKSFDRGIKHFKQLTDLYGDNYLINLVNHKGYELPVKEGYEQLYEKIKELPKNTFSADIKYIYFDFHKECSKMRWDNVNNLLKALQDLDYHQKENTYFQYDIQSKKVDQLQQNVVRSNCMDCLDRTNVVQSVLAGWQLQKQLTSLLNLPASHDGNIPDFPLTWKEDKEFLYDFQNLWADNADFVSLSYSGTGALKTDFTRTGTRTKKGALQDLKNSITRYLKNNYKDGQRQDGYDLVLGNFKPYNYDSSLSPFEDRRPFNVQVIPSVLYVSALVLVTTFLKPFNGTINNFKNKSVMSVSILTILLCVRYCIKNGMQFVNWPKFVTLENLQIENRVTKDNQFKGIWFKVASKYNKARKDL
ncbi:hypothetical protein FOG51_02246 [Hanseniaspora uvarum]|nr:hypothetical protein FOG48_03951 [Hanseniaspora uvarum]KAF0272954.1 hypothetical protein FOG51_02246 [Hanseniaspora uvarum]